MKIAIPIMIIVAYMLLASQIRINHNETMRAIIHHDETLAKTAEALAKGTWGGSEAISENARKMTTE